MPWSRLVATLLFSLLVVACSPDEEALRGFRSCGSLEVGADYGNTRLIPEVEVILFSRPGRYAPEVAARLTGLRGEVNHVSRTVGPCGQQDLFLSFDGVQWCAAVVGRGWDGQVCWDTEDPPFGLRVPVKGLAGEVIVAWAPGGDRSHVVATTDGGITVAAFVREGLALVTVPGGVTALDVVASDGTVDRLMP